VQIVFDLMSCKGAEVFNQPVQAKHAPGYFDKIQEPKDLGTIYSSLKDGLYSTAHQVRKDVTLVWKNCLIYNGADSGKAASAAASHPPWPLRIWSAKPRQRVRLRCCAGGKSNSLVSLLPPCVCSAELTYMANGLAEQFDQMFDEAVKAPQHLGMASFNQVCPARHSEPFCEP